MATYKVVGEFLVSVTTYVDTEDINSFNEVTEESVIEEARQNIVGGNYESGDAIDDPKIEFIECQECECGFGIHKDKCPYSDFGYDDD